MNQMYTKTRNFLEKVDKDFPIPLSVKQNLDEYTHKILKYATICSVEFDEQICAAAIGYTDNLTDNLAYIAVVAVLPSCRNHGYATQCIREFMQICRAKRITGIHLYADTSNLAAIQMYRKLGFHIYKSENESRPDDTHLICHLSEPLKS